jgi:pimeloyl-ACP methyl ester carboxylesterase
MILPADDLGDGPAVVLLHAGVADRTMWSEHLEPLARAGYRVISMDLPGFGEAKFGAELAPWTDVLETMDALGVDRAALVGNSFGGAVALAVAVTAPGRVAALVLVSAPPPDLEPSPQLQAVWDAEESALDDGDLEAAVAIVVDAWTLPDAPSSLRERVGRMQRRALELQMMEEEPVEAPDPVEADPGAIEQLEMPALVAVGELDMPDFVTGAQTLAGRLSGASAVTISGAGHLAPLEQPQRFHELLVEFLGRSVRDER